MKEKELEVKIIATLQSRAAKQALVGKWMEEERKQGFSYQS